MIERFKEELSEKIRQKEVALVLLADRSGRIRWHAGRPIEGRTVQDGRGFSRTHLLQALERGGEVARDDVMITADELGFPASARFLFVRSLFVHPVDDDLVLYVDSGNDRLEAADLDFFRASGSALRGLLAELRGVEAAAGGITGSSEAVQHLRRLALAYAIEDDPVLILGETGVGKSHIAQLIHRFSGRAGQFIIVDTPAVHESLVESELFGHARGAFTGAVRDKRGLVEAAAGGTLFLDEIAEVPLPFQAKLLRFIETRRFRAVGDTRERDVDVRIIAATNRDLREEIARQRFREDLYYRLSVLTLAIPPLRERPEDLRALVAEHEALLRGKRLGPEFWRVAADHPWAGNVRELVSVLKRAGIQLPGPTIDGDVATLLSPITSPPRSADTPAGLERVREGLASGRSFWDTAWAAFLDRELNRSELHAFLSGEFEAARHSLRELARRLNVADSEYPRFVSALHRYRVHPGR